jgi:hypothetical protein
MLECELISCRKLEGVGTVEVYLLSKCLCDWGEYSYSSMQTQVHGVY